MDRIILCDSPVGKLTVASDGECITGLWLQDQAFFGDTLAAETADGCDLQVLKDARCWLDKYFSGCRPSPSELPLRPKGTPFRHEVWEILLTISYGRTLTYGDIAKILAKRRGIKTMSSQAVGRAVGRNPISIIIPCHRVIGSDGGLCGYAGGLERKRWLLEMEAGTNQP